MRKIKNSVVLGSVFVSIFAATSAISQTVDGAAVTAAGASGVSEMWVIFGALTAFYLAPAIIKGLRGMLKGS